MRVISKETVYQKVSISRAIAAVREGFIDYATGKSRMPEKIYLDLPEFHGDFRAMPAYASRYGIVGVKWVNSHRDNPKTHQLPAVMAHLLVNDAKTGAPIALIDGTSITNLRTGAAGGIAADALSLSSVTTVGFIGCGQQAIFQLKALLEVRQISTVYCFDLSADQIKLFHNAISDFYDGKCHVSETISECCLHSQILVTTTPSRSPLISSEMIQPGTHINAFGADAPGKQELMPSLLHKHRVFVDDIPQSCHSGELNVPISEGDYQSSDIAGTLGAVLMTGCQGRQTNEDITIFDSTGLAIQDLAIASLLL